RMSSQGDPAVLTQARKCTVWRIRDMLVANARWNFLVCRVAQDGRTQQTYRWLDLRQIDVLALSGATTMTKRSQYREGGVRRVRYVVWIIRAGACWLPIGQP